jgi:hypothetical protein
VPPNRRDCNADVAREPTRGGNTLTPSAERTRDEIEHGRPVPRRGFALKRRHSVASFYALRHGAERQIGRASDVTLCRKRRPPTQRRLRDVQGDFTPARPVRLSVGTVPMRKPLSTGPSAAAPFVGKSCIRRRVDAGDPNVIAMWNRTGGSERHDRRRRWWSDHHDQFAAALL